MSTIINEFGKGVVFTAPIDLGAKKPLDSRIAVNTLAERDAHITGNRCYIGMQVYVAATGLTYRYDGQDTQSAHIWSIVADREWVLQQIQQGGISEARVREIFAEMFAAKEKEGTANDVRSYGSIMSFPLVTKVTVESKDHYYTTKWEESYTGAIPSTNVEYVDEATSLEYIWKEIDSVDYSGEYIQVNQTTDAKDIEDMFESK